MRNIIEIEHLSKSFGDVKAVQDIKSIFKEKKQVICPIVFLRDDIYLLIKDTDKNKWGDFKIALEWDEPKLKAMLAYRISKAIDENGKILSFQDKKVIIQNMIASTTGLTTISIHSI